MQEAPQQYCQRLLGYIEGRDPLGILAVTPRHLERLLKGFLLPTLATGFIAILLITEAEHFNSCHRLGLK
jgi:hypothetical protein